MKYIVVTGGTVSGIGKGVVASSTGKILQKHGIDVTFIKIDPYINLDAGNITPVDHGEVFVLGDGTEVDLDLGNYERFLNINLTRDNSITTGKIYNRIISRERAGHYLGSTVQIVPHVTDLIQEKILNASKKKILYGVNSSENNDYRKASVCIIELGGTVGDIEGLVFVEALRQLKCKVGKDNFTVIGVEHVLTINKGEQKTKPIQNSVIKSAGYGLKPDIIVGRCDEPMSESVLNKISLYCEIPKAALFSFTNIDSLYKAPSLLEEQKYSAAVFHALKIHRTLDTPGLYDFPYAFPKGKGKEVVISVVGKYMKNQDCYLSLENALNFSAALLNINLKVNWIEANDLISKFERTITLLDESSGILIPGGFGHRGCEGKVVAIRYARENNIPFLGICLGFQLAVIEFARNVMHIRDATSEEFDSDADTKVIKFMNYADKEHVKSSMRLGDHKVLFSCESKSKEIYKNNAVIYERFRHRYGVNEEYCESIQNAGMDFVATDESGNIMCVLELQNHPFFIGVQYHPEFNARPEQPHCLFTEFLRHSKGGDN